MADGAVGGPVDGPVDLALVLALDGSASVTYGEFGLIAGGLAEALRAPEVRMGLLSGPRGGSAVSVLLWSGAGEQAVMVNWTRVRTPAEAAALADAVDTVPRAVRAGATAIGEALIEAARLLAAGPEATRRVIDVAGDGRSNAGVAPAPVRDRLAAAGVTINGLCVLHEEADLLDSYTAEVIGGPGAFALTCDTYAAFGEAMRRKLTREIGDRPIA